MTDCELRSGFHSAPHEDLCAYRTFWTNLLLSQFVFDVDNRNVQHPAADSDDLVFFVFGCRGDDVQTLLPCVPQKMVNHKFIMRG